MRKVMIALLLLVANLSLYGQKNVVLYNANLVDVESGMILPAKTIVVEDGRITEIKNAAKHIGTNQVDVSGKYVMPGLIDSHLHWANFASKRPELDSLCKVYLLDGVTTVRDVGGDASVLKMYNQLVESGELNGPTAYYCSFWAGPDYFKLRGGDEAVDLPWNMEIKVGSDYEKAILAAKECGCMGLKLYADLTYEQLVEIVTLCKKHDIAPWGHFATKEGNLMEVVQAGVEVVSHTYYLAELKGGMEQLFEEMLRRGTILDPTLTISIENKMEGTVPNFIKAYKAGIPFVAGTDYIDITDKNEYTCFFLHEIDLYVNECGVSIPDALRAATVMGAKILGKKDQLGVIKVGAEADLLVLRSNPLESLNALRSIEMMYLDGKKVR